MNNKVIAVVILILVFLFPVRMGFLSDNLPGLRFVGGMVLTIFGMFGAMLLFNVKDNKRV